MLQRGQRQHVLQLRGALRSDSCQVRRVHGCGGNVAHGQHAVIGKRCHLAQRRIPMRNQSVDPLGGDPAACPGDRGAQDVSLAGVFGDSVELQLTDQRLVRVALLAELAGGTRGSEVVRACRNAPQVVEQHLCLRRGLRGLMQPGVGLVGNAVAGDGRELVFHCVEGQR